MHKKKGRPRPRFIAATLLATASLSLPAIGEASTGIGTPASGDRPINQTTVGAQASPVVSANGKGQFVVAWTGPDSGGIASAFARTFDAAGHAASPEIEVGASLGVVGIDDTGGFVVVTDGQARSFAADGTARGSVAVQGQVAVGVDGRFVAAWTKSISSSQYAVIARIYDAAGNALTGEVTAATVNSQYGTPGTIRKTGFAPDNGIYVVWENPTDHSLLARSFDAQGTPLSPSTTTACPGGSNTFCGTGLEVGVLMQSTGDYVVTYVFQASNGAQSFQGRTVLKAGGTSNGFMQIVGGPLFICGSKGFGAIAQSDGSYVAWSTTDPSSTGSFDPRVVFQVSTHDTQYLGGGWLDAAPGSEYCAAFATTLPNEMAAAWYDNGPQGYGLYARRLSFDGTYLTDPTLVAAGSVNNVSVVSDTLGRFTVVWEANDTSGTGIFARPFDAAGSPLADAYPVNDYATSAQAIVRSMSDADGDLGVVFRSFGEDGDGDGLFLRRFAGPEPVNVGVSLSVTPDPVAQGGTVSYSATVRNLHATAAAGIGSADDLVLTAPFPSGTSFLSVNAPAPWACDHTATLMTCTRPEPLEPGDHQAVAYKLVAPSANTVLTASVALSGTQFDANEASTGGNNASSATTHVGNCNPGTIAFAQPTSRIVENAGKLPISVTRTGGSCGPASATVHFVAKTAKAGLDFTAVDKVVEWADGVSTPRSVQVPIIDDTLDEDDETFVANLTAVTGASVGANAQHTATITDNDVSPTLSFARGKGKVVEAGSLSVTINLSAASGRTVTVDLGAGGTASADDYQPLPTTVTFNPGVTSKKVRLVTNDDAQVEGTEVVRLSLGTPSNATVGAIAIDRVTILDND